MSAEEAAQEQQLVGRCYTKARRLPLVMGQWSGVRLWGGPYTVPQLVTIVVGTGLMLLSYPLWAHFGFVNVVFLLGVPIGASFVVRQLHMRGVNPLTTAASAAELLLAPAGGRVGGRAVPRRPRPVRVAGACTLAWRSVAAPVRRRAGAVVAEALGPAGGVVASPRGPVTGSSSAPGLAARPARRVAAVDEGRAAVVSGAAAALAARRSELGVGS